MPDQNAQPDDNEKESERDENAAPKPMREVTVRHLDAPPPSGKRNIHPRRPAPVVPDRKQRTGKDKN
jgi:hypothetical protein